MDYIPAKNLAKAMKVYGDSTDHIKCAGRLGKFPIFGDTVTQVAIGQLLKSQQTVAVRQWEGVDIIV
jgi:hypothetical protein